MVSVAFSLFMQQHSGGAKSVLDAGMHQVTSQQRMCITCMKAGSAAGASLLLQL